MTFESMLVFVLVFVLLYAYGMKCAGNKYGAWLFDGLVALLLIIAIITHKIIP